jgi:hypothetical protein
LPLWGFIGGIPDYEAILYPTGGTQEPSASIYPYWGVDRSLRLQFTPIGGSTGALGTILPLLGGRQEPSASIYPYWGVDRSPRHYFTPIGGSTGAFGFNLPLLGGRQEPSALFYPYIPYNLCDLDLFIPLQV